MVAVQALYTDLKGLYNDLLSISLQQTAWLRRFIYETDQGFAEEDSDIEEIQQMEVFLERRDQIAQQIEAVQKQIAEAGTGGYAALDDTSRLKMITLVGDTIANDEVNQKLAFSLQCSTQKKMGIIRKNEKAYNAYTYTVVDPWFVDSKK